MSSRSVPVALRFPKSVDFLAPVVVPHIKHGPRFEELVLGTSSSALAYSNRGGGYRYHRQLIYLVDALIGRAQAGEGRCWSRADLNDGQFPDLGRKFFWQVCKRLPARWQNQLRLMVSVGTELDWAFGADAIFFLEDLTVGAGDRRFVTVDLSLGDKTKQAKAIGAVTKADFILTPDHYRQRRGQHLGRLGYQIALRLWGKTSTPSKKGKVVLSRRRLALQRSLDSIVALSTRRWRRQLAQAKGRRR